MYIYGAGRYGVYLYKLLSEMGIKVDGFVETIVEPEEKMCCDLPIISKDEALAIRPEPMIGISLSKRNVAEEIKNELVSRGFPECNIILCAGIVDENQYFIQEYVKGENNCCFCNKSDVLFEAGGIKNSFFETNRVVGGGYRERCICPVCGSLDRERWIYYLLKNVINIFEKENTVLHFAPEKQIKSLFEKCEKIDYYPCDLFPNAHEHKVNILDIPYKDDMFDYVICNHVLEHIEDENKAIAELVRVLKPDGRIILSFPVCMERPTYENSTIQTREDRLANFGQEDHVRLYGYDYAKHIEDKGLKTKAYSPNEMLSEDEIRINGYIENDLVLVCSLK